MNIIRICIEQKAHRVAEGKNPIGLPIEPFQDGGLGQLIS